MRLSDFDKNFKIETSIDKDNIKFYDCTEEPFKVYGLLKPDDESDYFRRVPQDIADRVNEGVQIATKDTAGGRVTFRTNSKYVAINAVMHSVDLFSHFAFTGMGGFDLYNRVDGKEIYCSTFIPPMGMTDGYESIFEFDDEGERDITINFPLYSGVKRLYIGLEDTATLTAATDYKMKGRIVYYGSSITHGGCASRPGNAYPAMISRELDCDHFNLGFSGSARGETLMAEYIASLDMSAFVYDYDHNSHNSEHLKETHKPFFDIIRKAYPDIPIVIVSRPEWRKKPIADVNYGIIEETYKMAKDSGDKNVYLIDGRTIMKGIEIGGGTVDGTHPNDLGFACMAKSIGDMLKVSFENLKK